MTEQAQRSWWGRHWKWVVPLGCLTPILGCGGFVAMILSLVFGMIKSSEPYTESLAIVQADPQAVAALGQPIEPGFFVAGNINISGASGFADISYAVSGPQGSGTVYVVAEKASGQWTFGTLDLVTDADSQRFDLLLPVPVP